MQPEPAHKYQGGWKVVFYLLNKRYSLDTNIRIWVELSIGLCFLGFWFKGLGEDISGLLGWL